jgi:hypothetical protein
MGLRDALREATRLLTETAVVLAIVVFWLLGSLADAAGLLGLWLAAVLLPAFFRYALYILEARAHGRDAPVLGVELFNWIENFWSLMPLLLLVALALIVDFLADNAGPVVAAAAVGVSLVVLPASLGVLGLTHSPLTCLNPAAMLRLVRAVGASYLWIPAVVMALSALFLVATRFGLPQLFVNLAGIYVFFTMFSMTGALLKAHRIDQEVDIPEPRLPDATDLEAARAAERKKVANHAYAFVSRGNRDGGLRHIDTWLRENGASDDAWYWFLDEMLTWEFTDAALLFAQRLLGRLLRQGSELEFTKLLARCLMVDSRFRPAADDQAETLALLRRNGRADLVDQLQKR